MADLEELADELYAVPPADFVAARKEAVSAARADGDKSAATALAALKKPTVAAWLVNQLVRAHPDDVDSAIALGAELRDATVAGDRDALRELTARRAQLVSQLVRHARAIAEEHGQATTAETQRELESTITTAAIDPAAADQLRSGRLTSVLTSEGFGFDHGALPPPRDPAAPPRVTPAPPTARVAREAEATIVIPSRRKGKAAPTAASAEPETSAAPEDAAAKAAGASKAAGAAEAARARAVEEAEQALAVARLQQADADAELADAERALEQATAAESEAAAAYKRAQAGLSDALADVRDARKDSAAADRKVVAALSRLEKATRPKR